MMGYMPQILPQSYIQTRSAFSGFGDAYSPPPLVQADASGGGSSGAGGLLSFVGTLFGSATRGSTQSSLEFNAAAGQLEASRLADDRSRRWAAFGAVAVGIAGLAGVVYLLRK